MNRRTMLMQNVLSATIVATMLATAVETQAVTQNYYGTTGALSTAVWSTNPAGPYTSAFNITGGGIANFDNAGTQAAGLNTLVVAGISATQNFSITGTPTGTISNQGNAVVPVTVASGVTLDFGAQAFTTSASAGYNFTGPGTLALLGGTYGGGFTINGGTVIVRGVNAMGGTATNTLTINGGTIASNANRDLSNKYGGGILLNGNVTLGGTTGLASATATLTFNNNINLGGGTRTVTVGNNAQHTFNTGAGIISNGSLVIDTVSGATGRIILLGQNTYSGGTTIKANATLSTNGISSVGSGPITSGPIGVGSLTIDGGTYIPSSSAANTIGNAIILNVPTSGENAFAVGGTSTLTGNITGLGGFRKGSGGILILAGTNTYSGVTFAESGTVAMAKPAAFYNGVVADWNDTKFIVGTGATLAFAVGGAGEFSLAQFLNLATVGTATGGFKDGSNIAIDTTNGGDQTISTVLANTNGGANRLGLAKSGAGTLFLTAANTHSGATTAVGGTINLSHLQALQNSTLTTTTTGTIVFDQSVGSTNWSVGGLAGNGALTLQDSASAPIALTFGSNNADATFSASISGSGGSLTKVGTGTQTLTASNSFDSGLTLSGGRLNINHAGALGTGTFTINNGATIDNSTGANIINSNNNAQVWNGSFTFLGTRALNLGTGAVTMAGDTTIDLPGTNATNNALTIGGVISGSGGLGKSGTGRMFLTGQSTFSGGVTITGGVVHTGDQNSNLGSGSGPLGTGMLRILGGQLIGSSGSVVDQTIENNIELTNGPDVNTITTNAILRLSGTISGTGGFGRSGNTTSSMFLSGANTYSGDTQLNSGTTTLANQLAAQNSTLVTVSTTTLAFDQSVGANAFTIGGLAGDGPVSLQNNGLVAIDLTVGNNNASTTHTGIVSGPGNLIKMGSGTTTLNGDNTYSGTTTVSAGRLLVNGIHTGGAAYTVNSGGTLGGSGNTGSAVTVNAGGILSPGVTVGTLTAPSADIDGKLKIEFGDNLIDRFTVTGALDITNTTVDFSALGSMVSGTYIFASYDSLVGTGFASVLNLPGTLSIQHDTLAKTFALAGSYSASVPGDYNLDGKVDSADYVVWRKDPTNPAFGGGGAAGYNLWRQNFGNPPGAGAGSSLGESGAVPEPTTCGLLLIAALSAFVGRRSRVAHFNS